MTLPAFGFVNVHHRPLADGIACEAEWMACAAATGRAGGRKLAGTAQSWRRIAGQAVVLAHAVIVVDADPQALTEFANAYERDLGSGRQYRAEALTSVAQAWQQARGGAAPADLQAQVAKVLAERFAHMLAAREFRT